MNRSIDRPTEQQRRRYVDANKERTTPHTVTTIPHTAGCMSLCIDRLYEILLFATRWPPTKVTSTRWRPLVNSDKGTSQQGDRRVPRRRHGAVPPRRVPAPGGAARRFFSDFVGC
jgi:hypothetical protein